ncbi:MAG: YibE/F family protein [Acidimicrobiales bacterium]
MAIAPFVLATVIGLVALWPGTTTTDALEGASPDDLVRAEVVSAERGPCTGTPDDAGITCSRPVVRLFESTEDVTRTTCPVPEPSGTCAVDEEVVVIEGAPKGEVIALPEQSEAGGAAQLSVGDEVVLGYFAAAGEGFQFSFADLERRRPLALLAGIFAVSVVALGRWKGLRALVGLGISLGVLTVFVLPALLEGGNPLAVALVGSAVIALTALYLAHGFSARTTTAVLGTLLSLALVGVLAAVFVDLARFTGLAEEEATFLQIFAAQVDLRGLLLGGIVIGALGVLDDVTVTQVSAVWELKRANPEYGVRDLYGAAVRIGRDHIASTVNTLVLAYAGASLPLMLLFTQSNQGLADVVNGELVAIEIVRTLAGSIGLVASVPFTTAVAALVVAGDPVVAGGEPAVAGRRPWRRRDPESDDGGDEEVADGGHDVTAPEDRPGATSRRAASGGEDRTEDRRSNDPRAGRSRREQRFWEDEG